MGGTGTKVYGLGIVIQHCLGRTTAERQPADIAVSIGLKHPDSQRVAGGLSGIH